MAIATGYGSPGCVDRFVNIGNIDAPSYTGLTPIYYNPPMPQKGFGIHPNQPVRKYPYAVYSIRHCNGTYAPLYTYGPAGTAPGVTPMASRTSVISPFRDDPAGTVYSGGFVAGGQWYDLSPSNTGTFNNTAWIFRGTP
jgi:hypothetical protein